MNLGQIIESSLAKIDSIEIVPQYLIPDSKNWCLINGVFGVVDKYLLKSFLQICPYDGQNLSSSESLLIILATTENAVAVNSRKRMCEAQIIDPKQELQLCTILLKSHLYKHCKSSWLWYHRRWLLEKFSLISSLVDEWNVVKLAAEHHPKNYYAWSYLRWYYCSRVIRNSAQQKFLAESVKTLCSANLGDVSMWAFLHWLNQPELTRFAYDMNKAYEGHEAILAAVRLPKNADS